MRLGCHRNVTKEKTRNKNKELATSCNILFHSKNNLNSNKIFDFQTLIKLYTTYTIYTSNVPFRLR